MSKQTASIFWNGRSQAVRIPKEFRFSGNKVLIEKDGDAIVLRPFEKEWNDEFWASLGSVSEDFERPKEKIQKRDRPFK